MSRFLIVLDPQTREKMISLILEDPPVLYGGIYIRETVPLKPRVRGSKRANHSKRLSKSCPRVLVFVRTCWGHWGQETIINLNPLYWPSTQPMGSAGTGTSYVSCRSRCIGHLPGGIRVDVIMENLEEICLRTMLFQGLTWNWS
jgi:hypothetical protein